MTPLNLDRYFLVLHRDFDTPILDLCVIAQVEGETMYITSTGHRAKPAAVWRLRDCLSNAEEVLETFSLVDWPAVEAFFNAPRNLDRKIERSHAKVEGAKLLAAIGLSAPAPKLNLLGPKP